MEALHISLSSWFRDYLYIPLGGNKGSTWIKIRNIFVVFVLSGFWHGSNWTFIAWGALNAFYFIPLMLLKRNRTNMDIVASDTLLPTVKDVLNIAMTFILTLFAWIVFRSQSLSETLTYFGRIFSKSVLSAPSYPGINSSLPTVALVIIFFVMEWAGRREQFAFAHIGRNWHKPLRLGMYYILTILILFYSNSPQPFIYFQF
jgi:D-alanyl-lipoteichoic acid acyltransferase DltB (MBOAT superfamily)